MCKFYKTETSTKIGAMTYVREVTEIDFYNCMCLCFSLIQSAYFLSLFGLVSLLSKQLSIYILLLHVFS